MSDAPENEEVGPELPPTLSPGKHEQPIDIAHVDVPPGKSPESTPVNEVSCSVENGHSPFIDPESATVGNLGDEQDLAKVDGGHVKSTLAVEVKDEDSKVPLEKSDGLVDTTVSADGPEAIKMVSAAKVEDSEITESKTGGHDSSVPSVDNEDIGVTDVASADIKADNFGAEPMKIETHQVETPVPKDKGNLSLKNLFLLEENDEDSESGTEEDQLAFMKELENFFKEKGMEFKPPKFYGEGLNCLKLWRAVTRLGGYEKVTSCKLWRQVGESFKPPKTCTTVSWTFRGFYEKALLDYERDKIHAGELSLSVASPAEPMSVDNQASGSNRARRDAAARAMQGWSSQRILNNGEVSDPIIKDKNAKSLQKREKQLKSLSSLKRKKPANSENAAKPNCTESSSQLNIVVVDIGPPADWVKINVQRSKDCFEVYALVPGLLREEVRVQSDPAGRLVISGEPEHLDNPWGVTPFKKVLNLPARIDPHQTSAVVTLHGQLYVRVPYEQSEP